MVFQKEAIEKWMLPVFGKCTISTTLRHFDSYLCQLSSLFISCKPSLDLAPGAGNLFVFDVGELRIDKSRKRDIQSNVSAVSTEDFLPDFAAGHSESFI